MYSTPPPHGSEQIPAGASIPRSLHPAMTGVATSSGNVSPSAPRALDVVTTMFSDLHADPALLAAVLHEQSAESLAQLIQDLQQSESRGSALGSMAAVPASQQEATAAAFAQAQAINVLSQRSLSRAEGKITQQQQQQLYGDLIGAPAPPAVSCSSCWWCGPPWIRSGNASPGQPWEGGGQALPSQTPLPPKLGSWLRNISAAEIWLNCQRVRRWCVCEMRMGRGCKPSECH